MLTAVSDGALLFTLTVSRPCIFHHISASAESFKVFIGALCAPVYLFMLPPFDPRPGVPYKQRLSQLDYLGTLLMVGACVAGVMAISFGGIIYPWNSGQVISCFVISGVLFIAFGLQQAFGILTTEETRIFPCQFLKQKTLVILFMQMSAVIVVFFVPIYFIPLFFQFARNDSAIEAGVRLLPLICFHVFAVILNGALMSKYGYYMPWYLAGSCVALIGTALMYTVRLDTPVSKIYGYTILLGLGSGMYTQAGFAVAQVKVQPPEIPLAIGFISLAQIGGATIALAIANSVFLNQATTGILAILPHESRSVVQSAVSGAGSTFFQTLDPSVKTAVLGAVTHAMSRIYILGITGTALSIVLAVFMSREKVSEFRPTFFSPLFRSIHVAAVRRLYLPLSFCQKFFRKFFIYLGNEMADWDVFSFSWQLAQLAEPTEVLIGGVRECALQYIAEYALFIS